jgi:hemerythrin-like domain-containing protein
MKPVEILSQEHRVIEVMLACLTKMTDQAEAAGRLEKKPATDAIDFIRNFADRCHHGKEEDRLFPAMEAKGMPREGGPIGVMLMEHDMGREFVRQMADNLEAASNGDAGALHKFAAGARGYVQLLRSHIMKEDQILFPMADRLMDQNDQEKLLKQFDIVETEHMGHGTHERYLKMAESLAELYGVSSQAIKNLTEHGSCGCGHKAAHA